MRDVRDYLLVILCLVALGTTFFGTNWTVTVNGKKYVIEVSGNSK